MVKVASPLASVISLSDEIDKSLLPEGAILAVTLSPSTEQPSSPVIFTVTSLLAFLLSVSLFGDTTIEVATHTGVAVDIGVTEGEGVGVVIAGVMSKPESWTFDDPS